MGPARMRGCLRTACNLARFSGALDSIACCAFHLLATGPPSPPLPGAGKPLKTVLNLSTAIDTLHFNHDGQMLVLASRLQRDALRCALCECECAALPQAAALTSCCLLAQTAPSVQQECHAGTGALLI